MDVKYEVFHSEYSGPLEGLLDSSRKQDVVLSRVDIAKLIDDFFRYLEDQTGGSVNILSESLLIFSELIRIKTRDLLPGEEDFEKDAGEPKQRDNDGFYEFVSERLRNRAQRRSELYESPSDSLPEEVREGDTQYREVTLYELIEKFKQIMVTTREEHTPSFELTDDFETSDCMERILRRTRNSSPADFRSLLSDSPGREEIIVMFLAILQLVKQNDLLLIQPVRGGSIKVVSPDNFTRPKEQ